MSPRSLLTTTITDELRLASNFKSKVVGVSLKDRASILPAGHNPTGAFWIDDASGRFITSTYYMKTLPDWVNAFNDAQPVEKLVANYGPYLKIVYRKPPLRDGGPWVVLYWKAGG